MRAQKNTGPQGPDVIYDRSAGTMRGGAARNRVGGGRFLVVGFASGEIPKLPLIS